MEQPTFFPKKTYPKFTFIIITATIIVYLLTNNSRRCNESRRNCGFDKFNQTRSQFTKAMFSMSAMTSVVTQQKDESPNFLEKLEMTNLRIIGSFAQENCQHLLNLRSWRTNTVNICLVPPELDDHVSGTMRRGGIWEPAIQDAMFGNAFHRYPKAAFIDIGGYIGLYSLTAAALGRQVFTFEPMNTSLR